MQITNKKLIKNFSDILSASIKAKDILNSEMEKVDAKYAELAKKEKADMAKQVSILEAQISTYEALLNSSESSEPEVDESNSAEENNKVSTEKVVDTLFPENNEASSESAEEVEEAEVEETPSEEAVEQQTSEDEFEETVEEEDEAEDEDVVDSESDWPEMPEEWK